MRLSTVKQFKFLGILFLGLVAANAAYTFDNYISWFYISCFFLIIPGFLLIKLLLRNITSRWEQLFYSLTLSLFCLMVEGLALNTLHVFGLHEPLNTFNIFVTLDVITTLLLVLNRKTLLNTKLDKIYFTKLNYLTMALSLLLPLLAILGANRINNGSSGIVTMFMFGMIAVLFIYLAITKSQFRVYPFVLVMMALAILYSTSLRGSLVTGHDIQHEFYVFQLTYKSKYWNISALRDPYNACLSITILPTVIARLTQLPSLYIFKFVFQAIFAIGTLPVYLFVKKFAKPQLAFIAGFVFISFPTFLNDMPFLNRQEIGFIFFGAMFLVAFSAIEIRMKRLLVFILLAGLVLSHYSSCYIALGLLIIAFFITKIFKSLNIQENIKQPLVSLPLILLALLLTFLWNSQITTTTGGLKDTLSGTVKELLDHSSAQSNDASYSLISPKVQSPPLLLNSYAGNDSSSVQYVSQPNLPITSFGKTISTFVSVDVINSILRDFTAKILQILIVVGIFVLSMRVRKNKNNSEVYYLAVSVGCFILLILQTLLPQLSVDYGTLRFFQQTLIILVLPIVLATDRIFRLFRINPVILSAVFFAFLFLDLCGFVPQLLGGYPPQLALNNTGEYYDLYLIHQSELDAASWTSLEAGNKYPVQMDEYAQLRFIYFTTNIRSLLPLQSNSYVYEDYANKNFNLFQVSIDGDGIPYRLTNGVGSKKNLVYNDQGSEVFK